MPNKVLELELSEGLKPIWGSARYDWINILVRYYGCPVGWVVIHNGDRDTVISSERLRYAIDHQIAWELIWIVLAEIRDDQLTNNPLLSSISVVVCTCDRTDQLEQGLRTLLAVDYPDYEIIVVDNASSNDNTAKLVAQFPVRYIREDRPGLDWARNRGLTEAQCDIIAFTDDDVQPDNLWLRSINTAFTDPEVMAVTGLVAPAELETSAQIFYEFGYGGMMQGLQRKFFQRDLLSRRDLLWASNFGAGANMAFRRKIFEKIGPFDVALDVGTPTGSGGDVELLHRLVAQGYKLAYDPRVIVWHVHRRDVASLRRQLHNNGLGFGSYLLTCARNRTMGYFSILHFALRHWFYGWILRRLIKPKWFPRRLIFSELIGAIRCPLAYRKAQRQAKQIGAMPDLYVHFSQKDREIVKTKANNKT